MTPGFELYRAMRGEADTGTMADYDARWSAISAHLEANTVLTGH